MEYLREVLCFFWYAFASITGVVIKVKKPTIISNKPKILIVSGVGGQPLAFLFLKKYLEQKGFSVYFLDINILQAFGIGFSNVEQIAEKVDLFVKKNNLHQVTLLGCSAGAIPCLIFLEKYGGWQYVRKFITLSAAFHSGWLSYLFFFIPISSQFNLSAIGKSLQHKEKIVSIFGTWDELVSPATSTLPGIREIKISEGGHAYLQTFSQKTFEVIAKEVA